MGLRLQNHDLDSAIVEKAPVKAWRLLRGWLLGSSLGAVTALVPIAANAQEAGSKHIVHHAGYHHDYIRPAAYHHYDARPSDHHHDYIRPAAYHRDDARPSHHDYIRPAAYHHEIHRDYYAHEHGATLIHADYRTERHYYHSGERVRAHFSYSRLECVPYAREVSHIELSGDAFLWWAEAAGRYERSDMPAVGAVLNFRSTGRMPLGHVAVVTAVLDSRTILVTQANWVPGTITNDVTIEDVSADNNWSAVRVEYGNDSTMGSTYPTYGFIYNSPAVAPAVYAANAGGRNEVAEAPAAPVILIQAPNRSLR